MVDLTRFDYGNHLGTKYSKYEVPPTKFQNMDLCISPFPFERLFCISYICPRFSIFQPVYLRKVATLSLTAPKISTPLQSPTSSSEPHGKRLKTHQNGHPQGFQKRFSQKSKHAKLSRRTPHLDLNLTSIIRHLKLATVSKSFPGNPLPILQLPLNPSYAFKSIIFPRSNPPSRNLGSFVLRRSTSEYRPRLDSGISSSASSGLRSAKVSARAMGRVMDERQHPEQSPFQTQPQSRPGSPRGRIIERTDEAANQRSTSMELNLEGRLSALPRLNIEGATERKMYRDADEKRQRVSIKSRRSPTTALNPSPSQNQALNSAKREGKGKCLLRSSSLRHSAPSTNEIDATAHQFHSIEAADELTHSMILEGHINRTPGATMPLLKKGANRNVEYVIKTERRDMGKAGRMGNVVAERERWSMRGCGRDFGDGSEGCLEGGKRAGVAGLDLMLR